MVKHSAVTVLRALLLGLAISSLAARAIAQSNVADLGASPISTSQIYLSWSDDGQVNAWGGSYDLYRSTSQEQWTFAYIGSVSVIGNPDNPTYTTRSYTDSGLAAGTTYYYFLCSNIGNLGNWCPSNTTGATTYAPPNGAPYGLGATAVSGSQINIGWVDNSSNESSFKIERKTGAGGAYSLIATVGANVTTFADTGLISGDTYYYRVYAANSWGASGYTNEASATAPTIPATPTGLSAASTAPTLVNLAWVDASNNETAFLIERKTGVGGTYSQIASVAANTASYVDTGLTADTVYYYRIRSTNVGGTSSYSNEAYTMTGIPPSAPSGLGAAPVGPSQVSLAWTDTSANETGFKIERKTGTNGTYVQIAAIGANVSVYSDSGLTASTSYFYRVRATNASSDSGYSNEAAVTTPPIADATTGTVEYTYDPFGNLIQTNAGGVITALTYDLRGRKIAMSDPDMGNWTYAYNGLGELVSQTDANGNVATMSYDVLGRMVSRHEGDLVSAWTYDDCTMGVGKLCSTTADNGYSRTHSYDTLGRPASVSTTIDATYVVSMAYDTAGRVAIVTYPDGFATKNVYNALGYLAEVRNNTDDSLFWQAQAVSATGRVTQELLGSTLTTTRAYDVLDRLTGITASGTPGTAQSVAYAYDAIGNLTRRTDATQNNLIENFYYDSLNRLIASSGPGLTSRAYEYDALGNITYKSDVGSYTYGAKPHAVTGVSGTLNAAYTYDANGNLVSGAGRTLTYSSFNLPLTITQGADAFQYTYSVDHERVRLVVNRATGNTTTIYLNAGAALLYEKEIQPSGTIEYRHYVTGGAGLVGVYVTKSAYDPGDGPGMRYFHLDHLGSVAVITNGAGAVVERMAFEAFGKRRFPNGTDDPNNTIFGVSTERGFTGHEHLDELGLIHMNGRVYDPLLGRFMTADPFVQATGNLQSYNRYAYGFNNPLAGSDPSGFRFSFWDNAAWDSLERESNHLGNIVDKIVANVIENGLIFSIVAAWITGGAIAGADWAMAGGTGGGFGAGGAAAIGASAGFTSGMYQSDGDVRAGLKGGARGAATAFLFYEAGGIGQETDVSRALAHAAAGCAAGAIAHSGCGPQAIAAVLGHIAGVSTTNALNNNLIGGFVAAVVAGGLGSKLAGGKFENGAYTAAFGYLFNQTLHQIQKAMEAEQTACTGPTIACAEARARTDSVVKLTAREEALEPSHPELFIPIVRPAGMAVEASMPFLRACALCVDLLGLQPNLGRVIESRPPYSFFRNARTLDEIRSASEASRGAGSVILK